MREPTPEYDVIVAGAGPAGSSTAIHLALHGARVFLVEQRKFPREKLCGEFISPECLTHFERLGVADRMLRSGGELVTQTVFYSRRGQSVKVPSSWFDGQNGALGLSRAEMDLQLLERARAVGVIVAEETSACGLLSKGKRITGLQLKSAGTVQQATAAVVIDATGRTSLSRHRLVNDTGQLIGKSRSRKAALVAFKAHLENAHPEPKTCEIYFYPGGYGGLSHIENGLTNLCFIAASEDVRECSADPETAMRKLVERNVRAAKTLAGAKVCGEWLAVSLESFGRRPPVPFDGMLSVGDAAAFIDPFSGSGMLMALESGALAAGTVLQHLPELRIGESYGSLKQSYHKLYQRQFGPRLRVCSIMRRAAFMPVCADMAIKLFGASDRLRQTLAQATRAPGRV